MNPLNNGLWAYLAASPLLGLTVTLVAYQDELEFGLGQEPDKWIPTVAEFKARWLQDNDAFAIMPISEYEHLKAENLPMEVKARNQRSVIVRKPGSH